MKIIITETHHVLDTGEANILIITESQASLRTTFQIQFCVATVGWQVRASSALFLNSQNEADSKTLLQLTTPASSEPEEGPAPRHGQQALVLNSRGRSASAETPRARLRVRLPRKSDDAGRFSQFPAVAPLENMKAPAERDPLTPVIR